MDAYEVVAKCYNENNYEPLNDYLSEDCVYRSQWVFDEMRGRDKIVKHLIAKSETIAKHNAYPKAKIVRIISPQPQQAVAVSQGSAEIKILVLLTTEEDKIKSIDICIPGLFTYEDE